ncbi:hypothetical protein L218DRAFT_962353 [Marasmius fiardii PR-910]|nr:hypothetical protein L218DRAFT_962353 [Marasmius fiardii PR-910]
MNFGLADLTVVVCLQWILGSTLAYSLEFAPKDPLINPSRRTHFCGLNAPTFVREFGSRLNIFQQVCPLLLQSSQMWSSNRITREKLLTHGRSCRNNSP